MEIYTKTKIEQCQFQTNKEPDEQLVHIIREGALCNVPVCNNWVENVALFSKWTENMPLRNKWRENVPLCSNWVENVTLCNE